MKLLRNLIIIAFCFATSPLLASTFTVVTTVDNGDNVTPVPGSLRAAILWTTELQTT
ncbi:MAG TPA: hypothetical protein VIM09_02720 [Chthoniobacterales bacterium]